MGVGTHAEDKEHCARDNDKVDDNSKLCIWCMLNILLMSECIYINVYKII